MFTPTIKYKRVNGDNASKPTGETNETTYNRSLTTGLNDHTDKSSNKVTLLDTNAPAPAPPGPLPTTPSTTTTTTAAPEIITTPAVTATTTTTTTATPAITFEEKEDASITIDPNDDERILITLSDGITQYTADRYCPHAGADLSYLGQVDEDEYPPEIGPILLCTLHYWEYALKRQGRGANGVATINACPKGDSLDCPAAKEALDW
jgi:nitrite reductase/ring-hydroxylating ferredoxin subunit